MGIGCVLFLWAVVMAIALVVAAGSAATLVRARARRSKLGMVAGGVSAVAGVAVAAGAFVFIAGWLFRGMRPHETSPAAFEHTFGVPASAAVTNVRSRTASSTDSHEQFLRFSAPPSTIAALVRTRFERARGEHCRQQWLGSKDDAPE